ncbi:MAG: hypothetical protein AAFN78_05830 [Pseudomonadota bacterium]
MTAIIRNTALGLVATLGLSGPTLADSNTTGAAVTAAAIVPLVLDAAEDVHFQQTHGRRYGHWHRYRGHRYWHSPRSYRSYRYGRYGYRYHPRYYRYRY